MDPSIENDHLEKIRRRLRLRNEQILSIFESYQKTSNENPNRLLVLVESNGTFAVFSLALLQLPPHYESDISIDAIYCVNSFFSINAEVKNSMTFEIVTLSDSPTFHYYPIPSIFKTDFDSFHRQVISAQEAFKSRQELDAASNSFSWLNEYKVDKDFIAIDVKAANGTRPLSKGVSKFQEELKKREQEYITYSDYTFYCGTWNVNGKGCTEHSLRSWLAKTTSPPDFYAIALQEVDLSAKAIAMNDSKIDQTWIRKFLDGLHSEAAYEELVSVRLVGMMLSIFVKQDIRQHVTRYTVSSAATGVFNVMGNKGGVAVSLTLNMTDICFVCSHLAAHMDQIERRNLDYAEIMKRCTFDEVFRKRTIKDHDQIFWLGDLNYRINEIPGQIVDRRDIAGLLKNDQLLQEMRKRNVFNDFEEGPITFNPTYKYDPGTDQYDSSEKMRAPAWCDRILRKGDRIQLILYDNVMEIRQSDHKPVYAVFSVGIKTKDDKKYKRVHEDVLKTVDKYENDNQPQISVEKTEIDFNEIRFNERLTRDFTIANSHHLSANFSFKEKEEQQICKKWFKVEPTTGTLLTGDSLIIRITFKGLDSRNIGEFLKIVKGGGSVPLDILVLHVQDGRDIFITINGEYIPSCFGFDMDLLCRTDRPIAEYSLEQLDELEKSSAKCDFKVTMPREIFFLIDYLSASVESMKDVFFLDRKHSKHHSLNLVRDWLDSWSRQDFRKFVERFV
ncbi:OCRL family protein [Megaselia abdita]